MALFKFDGRSCCLAGADDTNGHIVPALCATYILHATISHAVIFRSMWSNSISFAIENNGSSDFVSRTIYEEPNW